MRDKELEEEELKELLSQESNPDKEIPRLRRENRELRENLMYYKRKANDYKVVLSILLSQRPNESVKIAQELYEDAERNSEYTNIDIEYRGMDRMYIVRKGWWILNDLMQKCKEAYKSKDLNLAGKYWTEIYEKYAPSHNDEQFDSKFIEFSKAMEQFTDKEVYEITDYLKEQQYKKEGLI